MRDIENPMVEQMERTGYPDNEYVEYERQQDSSSSTEDEHN